jgi:hypothetical protein
MVIPINIRTKIQSIIYYISSHGFGHATRSAEVIAWLNRLAPDIRIIARTSAPGHIFEFAGCRLDLSPGIYDIGVIQHDGLNMNILQTIKAWEKLAESFDSLFMKEVEDAGSRDIIGIISDIPSFAFRVSEAIGVPGIAISNFSWDWIYEEWISDFSPLESIVNYLREEYSRCDLLLRLPFPGELPAFHRVEDIPLIGRKAVLAPDTVRQRLNLSNEKPLILLSFGGMGLRSVDLNLLARLHQYAFIAVGNHDAPVRQITNKDLLQTGIRYPDLVNSVDAVVTKPGYGIISECAANQTPVLYTDRGPFREYPVLIEQMRSYIKSEFICRSDFEACRWDKPLERLLTSSSPVTTIDCRGAEIAARKCLEMFE